MAAKTHALEVVQKAGVDHEVLSYTAGTDHFGEHGVEELGLDAAQTLKTLVIHHEREYAVCCVPVAGHLSLKLAAKALGWKNAEMADPKAAQRLTGYIVGGISPLGMKQTLSTLIDASVRDADAITVSAGQRGLSIAMSPGDLAELSGAEFADIAAV